MSASYLRECKGCGLQYTVEEHEQGFVTTVDGVVEQDCPKCGEELKAGEPLRVLKTLGDLLKRNDGE